MTEKEKPIFILPPPGEDDLTMGGQETDIESGLTIPGEKKLDEDTAFGLPVRPARKDMPPILGSKYVDAPVYGLNSMITGLLDLPTNLLAEVLEAANLIEPNENPRDYVDRLVNSGDYEKIEEILPGIVAGVGRRGSNYYDNWLEKTLRGTGEFAGFAAPFIGTLSVMGNQLRNLEKTGQSLQSTEAAKGFVQPIKDFFTTGSISGLFGVGLPKGTIRQSIVKPYADDTAAAAKAEGIRSTVFGFGYSGAESAGFSPEASLVAGLGTLSPVIAWQSGSSLLNALKEGPAGRGARYLSQKYDDYKVGKDEAVAKDEGVIGKLGFKGKATKEEEKLIEEVKLALENPKAVQNTERAQQIEEELFETTGKKITLSPAEQTMDVDLLAAQELVEKGKTATIAFSRKNRERKYNVIEAIEKYQTLKIPKGEIDDGPLFIYDALKAKRESLISKIDDQVDEVELSINKLSNEETGKFPLQQFKGETGVSIRTVLQKYVDNLKETARLFAEGKAPKGGTPIINTNLNDVDDIGKAIDIDDVRKYVTAKLTMSQGDEALTKPHPLIQRFLDKKDPKLTFADYKSFRMEVGDSLSKSFNLGISKDIAELSAFKEILEEMGKKFGNVNDDFKTFNQWYSVNMVPLEKAGVIRVLEKDVGGATGSAYKLPKEKVAEQFIKDSNTSKFYVDTFKGENDIGHIQSAILDTIHRAAYDSKKGALKPDAVNKYINNNADMLKEIPSFRFRNVDGKLPGPQSEPYANFYDELIDTSSLLQNLARRKADLDSRKKFINTNLIYKNLTNKFDELEPEKLFEEALKNPKLLRDLKSRLKIDASGEKSVIPGVSQKDLKTTFNAIMVGRIMRGEGGKGIAPDPVMNPNKFVDFLIEKEKMLTQAIGRQHLDSLKLIGETYERILATGPVEKPGNVTSLIGGSGWLNQLSDNLGTSVQSLTSRGIAVQEGRLSARTTGAYILTRFINAGQVNRAQIIFRDAIFDPQLAKELARPIKANKDAGFMISPENPTEPFQSKYLSNYLYGSGAEISGLNIFNIDKGGTPTPIKIEFPDPKTRPEPVLPKDLRKEKEEVLPTPTPSMDKDIFSPSSKIQTPPTPNISSVDTASLFPNDATAIAIAKRRAPQTGIGTLPT